MKSLYNSKIVKILVLLLTLLSLITYYNIPQKQAPSESEPYFVNWNWTQDISCHYEEEGNVLPSAEELFPPENSIFFHETSCRGGLTSREACAVESAATLHPERNIYVFFNSPVSEKVLTRSCLAKLVEFKNVAVARLHIAEYAKGTLLEYILDTKKNEEGEWRVQVTSDVLRFITMYKYGGIYLDTDVVVVKRLDSLGKDWVAWQDDEVVNVAVMAISKKGSGRQLLERILVDLQSDFRPNDWLYNGPGAMTRALLEFCNVSEVEELSTDKCHGFKIYLPSYFYPIHWTNAAAYFKSEIPNFDEQTYIHHFWNKLTLDKEVQRGSLYDILAKQYCPTIWKMYGDQFGT